MPDNHTPGPWFNDGTDIMAEDNFCVATVHRPRMDDEGTYMSNGRANANARLIAAAPELLAALKRIEHKWRSGDGSFSVGELCREMIAHAEGTATT